MPKPEMHKFIVNDARDGELEDVDPDAINGSASLLFAILSSGVGVDTDNLRYVMLRSTIDGQPFIVPFFGSSEEDILKVVKQVTLFETAIEMSKHPEVNCHALLTGTRFVTSRAGIKTELSGMRLNKYVSAVSVSVASLISEGLKIDLVNLILDFFDSTIGLLRLSMERGVPLIEQGTLLAAMVLTPGVSEGDINREARALLKASPMQIEVPHKPVEPGVFSVPGITGKDKYSLN